MYVTERDNQNDEYFIFIFVQTKDIWEIVLKSSDNKNTKKLQVEFFS